MNVEAALSVSPGMHTALRRVARLLVAALQSLVLPFVVTVAVVAFLSDPSHLDTSELRANSLLMHARPVFRQIAPGDEVRVALGDSAILLGAATLAAIAVGLPFGIAYGASSSGRLRSTVWSFSTLAASLPAFFWAIILALLSTLASVRFGLPFLPTAGFGVDNHLILPTLALGMRPATYVFRLTAIAIEDVRHGDFIRTAISKGLRDRDVVIRHVLPNALPSIVAAILLATRMALSSLVIVEYIFIWGGAGTLFVQSLGLRHLELATTLALSFAAGSVMLTFAADIARSRGPTTT